MQQDPAPNSGAYDFLNQQPSQNGRKLPLPKLPKLAWIILLGSLGLLGILVVIALLFGGNRGGSSNVYVEALAYAQEINRVSGEVTELSQDPATLSLAATTSSAVLSTSTELSAYLKDAGVELDTKSLASKVDEEVDKQLQEAAQSNRLPEAYIRYLNAYLPEYQAALQAAYNQTTRDEGRAIIQLGYDSVETILSSSSLKAGT